MGAAQPGINSSKLKDLKVPLPPLAEQQRIAAILDQADALRQRRKSTVRLIDEMRSAIFKECFISNEGHDWPLMRVADIATDMRTGPFGSQLLHSEFVDEGIAVLGIDNAVNNEFRWSERRYVTPQKYGELRRYRVRPGDVLITIMGTCGRCAVVPESIPTAINTKHLCCITVDPKKASPVFLHAAFLQHPRVLKQLGVQAKGAVMPGLNMGIIKSLELRLPPLKIQQTFAQRIKLLDSVLENCRHHAIYLDTLFASLQHRAFPGELTAKAAARELAEVG